MPTNHQQINRKGCLLMKYEVEFKLLLADLKKRHENANEEYKKSLPGTICQENRQGKQKLFYVYEEKGKRKRTVINNQPQLLTQLARKRYLEEELEILNKDMIALNRLIATYIEPTPETIIERLPAKYRDLPEEYFFYSQHEPITDVRSDMQTSASSKTYRQHWATQPYEQSTYKPEEKVQMTSSGLRVRTKSEVVVAEMLDAAGITYRYEQMIYIEDFSFAPDFTILSDKGIIYWEHAGMIHHTEYCNHHKWKMEMYEKAGIVPWKNLIITYDNENGGLDTRIIRSEIENKLL